MNDFGTGFVPLSLQRFGDYFVPSRVKNKLLIVEIYSIRL